MAKKLVIVESPTKAKTITRFLGKEYSVTSSYGHVRDLPKSKLGVDVDKDFAPVYEVPERSKKQVTDLKKKATAASEVYFATDEDREGEAIAWHLSELLKKEPDKLKRITFGEITEVAIKEALTQPRDIDSRLVDAQQARRVLDRLVGYELSPLLWKKVARGLSAGRVQSVAVRLIVEREREIKAFKPQEYWTMDGEWHTAKQELLKCHLAKKDGKALKKFDLPDEKSVSEIETALKNSQWQVATVTKKESKRNPQPPFTTSTLQQVANRKLGFSSKQTMVLAQQLYEGIKLGDEGHHGLITYMRTDSFALSDKFLKEAKTHLSQVHGKEYTLASPRHFKTKSKGAQEAHEAIRPTRANQTPESLKDHLDDRQYKLYSLIWARALATQMPEARLAATTIDIKPSSVDYTFRSTGSVIAFPGWLKLYPEQVNEISLPDLKEGDDLTITKLNKEQHFTEPPARYSEAGLVKILEEHGIGRPSTYAPTISTIIARGYVEKEEKRLIPTDIAFLVNDVLVEHFPNIVDYEFTAKMEEGLDQVADGKQKWVPLIKDFYTPFKKTLVTKEKELDKKELTEEATDHVCDKCGQPMIIKTGRFGKFLACTGYPDCKNTKNFNKDGSLSDKVEDKPMGEHPETKEPIYLKTGRFGTYLQMGEKKKGSKPKTASLLQGMSPETLTIDQAVELLSLPRALGQTDDGEDIIAANGRFGPYVKAGKETRSLGEEYQPTTITLDQAQELLKQPKKRGALGKKALKELGQTAEGKAIKLMSGRFGPYVTDGTVNVSLPKDKTAETFTPEEARALIEKKSLA